MTESGAEDFSAYSDLDHSGGAENWKRLLEDISTKPEVHHWRFCALESLKLDRAQHVLEVGCGLGQTTRAISERLSDKGQVIGIDLSEEMIAEAKTHTIHPQKEHYQKSDVTQLNFGNDCFDRVYLERVLHHLEDPEKALAEVFRVLQPGGRACLIEPDFTCPIIYPLADAIKYAVGERIGKTPAHGNIGLQLLDLAQKQGFRELDFAAHAMLFRDYAIVNAFTSINTLIHDICDSKSIAETHIQQLKQADQDKTFSMLIPMVRLLVAKP